MTRDEAMNMLQQQYPQYYALLQYDPQILDIFIQANENPAEWPPARLDAAIAATPWWQNTPAEQRKWLALNAVDPASARQRVDNTNFTVEQIARQLGMTLDTNGYLQLVYNAAALGWDANRIRSELFLIQNPQKGLDQQPGLVSSMMTEFNNIADQYGIPTTPDMLNWWASSVLAGNATKEGYESYIRDQASAFYPALQPKIAEGMTVAQYAQPYFALTSQELGINPNSIDLRDPKWTSLFLGNDQEKGIQGVRSLDEALAKIRSDPAYGYDTSLTGRAAASTLASQVGKMFGTAA